MKAVRPVIASNGVPYLQMRSVGSLSTSGREKDGKKERYDRIVLLKKNLLSIEPCATVKKKL